MHHHQTQQAISFAPQPLSTALPQSHPLNSQVSSLAAMWRGPQQGPCSGPASGLLMHSPVGTIPNSICTRPTSVPVSDDPPCTLQQGLQSLNSQISSAVVMWECLQNGVHGSPISTVPSLPHQLPGTTQLNTLNAQALNLTPSVGQRCFPAPKFRCSPTTNHHPLITTQCSPAYWDGPEHAHGPLSAWQVLHQRRER